MTRDEKIAQIAEELKAQIMANAHMACFGEMQVDGDPGSKTFGFDGYIDLKKLAEWVYMRMG